MSILKKIASHSITLFMVAYTTGIVISYYNLSFLPNVLAVSVPAAYFFYFIKKQK